ncbi:hypothetical protein [Asaia krungthepensis]|uniref:Uncharacterized protein n=1 Tax=Asaia krungthepensis NRIC 0535 TaxID=1307925 RepID=A0ABQ0Q381_9PROT|nr:hypothetical protein [Asaia krungthepensis]GBQ89263.1 hypothetical protein AA0535_1750 [Asaia krungthepensis NRIC 0535]
MARLVLGNTDASGTGRGWIAPTAIQPRFASFFLGGTLGANMALGGADAASIGAPTLEAGVIGKELPHLVTKGGANFLRTAIAEPREGTFFSIARMPAPPGAAPLGTTDGPLMGLYNSGNLMMLLTNAGIGGAFRTRMPEQQPEGWNTVPPVLADMTRWGLYALRYQNNGASVTGVAKAYTANRTASRTGSVAGAVSPAGIEIGSQPFSDSSDMQKGIAHQAAVMIWDVALSDAEMENVASLLRRWSARYGVTV